VQGTVVAGICRVVGLLFGVEGSGVVCLWLGVSGVVLVVVCMCGLWSVGEGGY